MMFWRRNESNERVPIGYATSNRAAAAISRLLDPDWVSISAPTATSEDELRSLWAQFELKSDLERENDEKC